MTGAAGRTALLAGGSGLVGGLAIPHLLAPGAFDRVIALRRRSLPARAGLDQRTAARAALDPVPGRFAWEYGALLSGGPGPPRSRE